MWLTIILGVGILLLVLCVSTHFRNLINQTINQQLTDEGDHYDHECE
jgi:Na+-driven multidrug efflux pump